MAKIIRGKHKDKVVKLRQYCNNWFHVEHKDIPNQEAIMSPLLLEFNKQEYDEIEFDRKLDRLGIMFINYNWSPISLSLGKYLIIKIEDVIKENKQIENRSKRNQTLEYISENFSNKGENK